MERLRAPSLGVLLSIIGLGASACGLLGGNGSESNTGEDNDTELTAPSTPESLSETSQDAVVSLEWDVVGEADSYRVYRSTSSGVDASENSLGNGIDSADYVDESAKSRLRRRKRQERDEILLRRNRRGERKR